jgi:flagellar biosynthetic protein FlhB
MAEKDSKTEKPTHWRLVKAKLKGDVPRSRELNLAVSLLMTALFFALYAPVIGRSLLGQLRHHLGSLAEQSVSVNSLVLLWRESLLFFLGLLGPLFALLIAIAILMTTIQGGFRFIFENLRFKMTPFKILKGLKRIFASVDALMELFKSLVKVAAIGYIAYLSIQIGRAHV